MPTNVFCSKIDLTNEASVEQFFVIRLLKHLGYKDSQIKPKNSIQSLNIGRGSAKENYKPDYAIKLKGKIRIIIEAKDPEENLEKWLYQPSGYCLALNQKDNKEDPTRYFILTNANLFSLYEWNNARPLISLKFDDFVHGNEKFLKLQKLIIPKAILKLIDKPLPKTEMFEFNKPELSELEGIFRACHNLIWKKEKKKPTEAFYEFTKLFFVKISHDKKLHDLGENIKKEDFKFSTDWIESMESDEVNNPISDILFKNIREDLERKVRSKEKKRIFKQDEKINLKPSTIKEVVGLLEHHNLFGIEEDLNGRMFEIFLNATIRGKELGQFFTPRPVVEFMVELADLKCGREHIDNVIDACCGSGGFLIDVMSSMWKKIRYNTSLSSAEKEKMKLDVVTKYMWGIDADKDERLPISKIARMNMVLHGDGSNRIYWLPDSLDKKIIIERGTEDELKEEAEELKEKLIKEEMKFDAVLTNPPFSMKYEKKKQDEKAILEDYEIAHKIENGELRPSVKSNVLFIERYKDLLKPHGKLITIIDESVLNTSSEKDFRTFIKKYFIIKAVISLPRNTFVNADTGVKTSVLYLMKKQREDEEQPDIFMAISENVGHSDSGRKTPALNDLPKILEAFKR